MLINNLKGSITQIKARRTVGGDTVQTVTFEVFGDFSKLHELIDKPLDITIKEEENLQGIQ